LSSPSNGVGSAGAYPPRCVTESPVEEIMVVLRLTQNQVLAQISDRNSRGLAFQRGIKLGFGLWRGARGLAEVELEDTGHHQHGLRPATIFQ
jgi:hypothetical protein